MALATEVQGALYEIAWLGSEPMEPILALDVDDAIERSMRLLIESGDEDKISLVCGVRIPGDDESFVTRRVNRAFRRLPDDMQEVAKRVLVKRNVDYFVQRLHEEV